jgi:2-oxoisovalerate dehydrogenase E1 component alpha subunit
LSTPNPAVEAIERIREADAVLAEAKVVPFPLPIAGLEAVVAGALLALDRGDWWVPGLRERVGAVLRDVPVERLVDGLSGARPYRVAPPTPSPALRALHGVGLALAGNRVVVHLGVGSSADGAFHEALNLAALRHANVVFLLAVMPLDEAAPVATQLAADPAALGAAFGVRTATVSGSSVEAVRSAVATALEAGGPQLIVATLDPGADLLALAKSES